MDVVVHHEEEQGPSKEAARRLWAMVEGERAPTASHPEADVARGEDGTPRPSPRGKLARLRRQVPLRLGEPALERLLLIHARSQPWHEWLEAAIEPTLCALATYRASRARDLIPE